MTGYQEILTDPSYAGQIVTLTYPHIGNVGVNAEDAESRRIFAAGLVIRDLPRRASSWRATGDLGRLPARRRTSSASPTSTRASSRASCARSGAQNGCIVAAPDDRDAEAEQALARARAAPSMAGLDLAKVVSCDEAYDWTPATWALGEGYRAAPEARFHVVAYDYGVKHNILRLLAQRGCRVHRRAGAARPRATCSRCKPDGVFLSNGPGDPEPCDYAIDAIREIVDARHADVRHLPRPPAARPRVGRAARSR